DRGRVRPELDSDPAERQPGQALAVEDALRRLQDDVAIETGGAIAGVPVGVTPSAVVHGAASYRRRRAAVNIIDSDVGRSVLSSGPNLGRRVRRQSTRCLSSAR